MSSPDLRFSVIPRLDRGISSQINLEFPRDPRVKPEDDIVGNSRIPKPQDPPKGLGDDIIRDSGIPKEKS